MGRRLGRGHRGGVNGRHQSLQQDAGLSLVLLSLAFQGAGQPVLDGLPDLRRRRRLCERVGLLAGIEPLHHLLHVHVDGSVGAGPAAAALVHAEGEAVEEGLGALLAAVGEVAAAVEAAVQLEVDVLGELGVAVLALVRFFPRVQPQVRFQVAGAAEAFVTHLALMWFLSRVDQVMFLEVSQLGEALFA